MVAAGMVVIVAIAGFGAAPSAQASPVGRRADELAAAMPPTKAWILVDADTGNVIAASNDRTPLPPASLTKVITAIAAVGVAPATPVKVSPVAAAAPADKLGLKAGEVWSADELFHALLISSANDAAVAMAEQVGRSLAGFHADFVKTAQVLGMADNPVLMDPAGLDGTQGVDGGNRVSARDLAIAGRALLTDSYLLNIVSQQVYRFTGPDGVKHSLVSHDRAFLSSYQGAVGIKTGFTTRAGVCLMAAAQRNGRTMLAVVLNSANTTTAAHLLLDQGFATPLDAEPTTDALPSVDLTALRQVPLSAPAGSSVAATPLPQRADTRAATTAGSSLENGKEGLPTATEVPGASSKGKFGALAVEGAIALALCLATVGSTRVQNRRVMAPNLWQQPSG